MFLSCLNDPALGVLFRLSCHSCHFSVVLSYCPAFCCHVLAVLSSVSYPGCAIPTLFSGCPQLTCFHCPGRPSLSVLSRLTCQDDLSRLTSPGCHVSLSHPMSCSRCPVSTVLSWLSSSSQLSFPSCHVLAALSSLSCLVHPDNLLRLSRLGFPVLAVLSRLSHPGCPVLIALFLFVFFPAALSYVSCPSCTIPAVLLAAL